MDFISVDVYLIKFNKDMRIYKEEIFGPVLSVVRVKTFEEAAKIN